MTKMFVITGFLIAFAAGLMTGVAWQSNYRAATEDRPRGDRNSWLVAELKLDENQQKQMKQIWMDVGNRGGRESRERRMQIRREQDEAIARLIHPEDLGAYDNVISEHKQKLDVLDAENKKSFQQAVEKTKAILSSEQLTKYEELLARPGSGPGGPGPEGRDHDRSASRPSERR